MPLGRMDHAHEASLVAHLQGLKRLHDDYLGMLKATEERKKRRKTELVNRIDAQMEALSQERSQIEQEYRESAETLKKYESIMDIVRGQEGVLEPLLPCLLRTGPWVNEVGTEEESIVSDMTPIPTWK